MKMAFALFAVLVLSACTMKYTSVEICPEVEEDGLMLLCIDTSGAQLSTMTDQKADGGQPQLDLNLPLGGFE